MMKKQRLTALLTCAALLACAACTPETEAEATPSPSPTPTPTAAASPTPAPTAGQPPILTGTPVPVEVDFAFTRANFPRMDGSLALGPLAQSVCSAILRVNREEVADLVRFNRTTTAYYNLLWGYADLLLVGEAGTDVLEEKESRDFQWDRAPYVMDALVVAVNAENPVDSVTVEELRKIYAGEITNWKELGGRNEEIVPIQRGKDTESQQAAERLFMGGAAMAEAQEGLIAAEPEELAALVGGEDAPAGAIGYSIYYFAAALEENEGIKLLKVNRAEPTADAIRAGKYPLAETYYAVIPASAAEDAPNRILFDWLLSEAGQRLAAHEGYVSVLKVESPPPAAENTP